MKVIALVVVVLGMCLFLCWNNLYYLFETAAPPTTVTSSPNSPTRLSSSSSSSSRATSHHHDYPFKFGACLLTKDEKQIIPEWIAYHYTVLPLRHLVVAIDPLSLTDPRPILDKYSKTLPDLHITVWTNQTQYVKRYNSKNESIIAKADPTHLQNSVKAKMNAHRQRQRAFYESCLEYFKSTTTTTTATTTSTTGHEPPNSDGSGDNSLPPLVPWVMLSDTDEYVTFNTKFLIADDESRQAAPQEDDIICQRRRCYRDPNATNATTTSMFILPQYIGRQNETLAHYIAKSTKFQQHTNQTLCRVFPRITFISNKEVDDQQLQSYLPSTNSPLNGSTFHTLRYQNYGQLIHKTLPGKAFVKIENYHPHGVHLGIKITNPHRPFDNLCDNSAFPRVSDGQQPFRFHHYTGSYETFVSRPSRPERSATMWLARNNVTRYTGIDDSLSQWVKEFVKLIPGDSEDDSNNKLFELTQQLREEAYQEALAIQHLVLDSQANQNTTNGTTETTTAVTPIFDWV